VLQQPRPQPLNPYSLAPYTGDEDTERFEPLTNEQSEPEHLLARVADCPCGLRTVAGETNEVQREGDGEK